MIVALTIASSLTILVSSLRYGRSCKFSYRCCIEYLKGVSIDFLKVARLVFWSGVVGPGTNFRSLALRARTIALRAQKLDL